MSICRITLTTSAGHAPLRRWHASASNRIRCGRIVLSVGGGEVCDVGQARIEELDAAVRVWSAAQVARGLDPGPERVARVHQKLADAAACVVVARSSAGDVVAMAMGEARRALDGFGEIEDGWGHIPMVFVQPEWWGKGLGGEVLECLHGVMAEHGWEGTSLWTREGNERAIRLCVRKGYAVNGRTSVMADGSSIVQLERAALR
jgi:GNAT superfamily N-acetyltransferase